MNLNYRCLSSRLAGIGLSLVCLTHGFAAASATCQASASSQDAAALKKLQEHSQLVDNILATDARLGSDAWRVQHLASSPRLHYMATIPTGSRTLQAFVVHPNTEDKVSVVLMIPEDQGLTDWAREMADQIAAMGYVVIVPDLLAGFGPNGGGHDSFSDKHAVLMAVEELKKETISADLNAWADYSKKTQQSNGKLALMGFGWGGGQAFSFATQRKDLSATFIFYDWAPPGTDLAGISAPVYGFYAEKDPRVTKSLDATKATMAALGKKYEAVMYTGSEHMFVRVGEMPGNEVPANIEARNLSLARLQQLLKGL